ncbi:MAG: transcriptional regulator GutM [Atopobiaceae bacterium]|nr:transcriptional regulator GutM [Atopobiaceae bacterium]MCH4119450.1 transcriptional regulator GutM [Atopobiaceae bacterium]MCI1318988.1 transcriptional regulator GutM [Atopobiaceae bacterium]MCI1389037.1 transcriptional regulator GutM [Atopobiaceae bacterium]MCI1431729.1 transcriptional regulator GutM [Atopobiaceae bacterium]
MPQILLLCLILVVCQSFLGLMQVHYYQRFVKRMCREYHGRDDMTLYTDVSDGRLSRTIVLVVVDQANDIVDCRVLSGMSVFTRFKRDDELIGTNLADARSKEEWKSLTDAQKGGADGRKEKAPVVEFVLAKIYERNVLAKQRDAGEQDDAGLLEPACVVEDAEAGSAASGA